MIQTLQNFLETPIFFLKRNLAERNFFIVSSVIVGLTSGLAAVGLKSLVHTLEIFVSFYDTNDERFFLFALFPLVGILLTVFFVRVFLKDKLKKGSAEIAYSIAKQSSNIPRREMFSHLITSGLTVGFGGSVGLESPMVSTGSAIGSNYGRNYKLTYKERTILLGCGAAAGIAAAFNSPIAGVLFAVEVILTEVSVAAFIPLIISAACGALLSKMILSESVILSFSLQQPFNYYNVPYYIALGIVTGLIALYYTRTFQWTEHKITAIANPWARAMFGGLLLFLILIICPPLFGEGYETIKSLAVLKPEALTKASLLHTFLNSQGALLLFLTLLMLLKSFAAAITLGSGGNGGNFGPSLFVGAYVGFIFSRLVNISGLSKIPESNFTLVAMAGILSGVFYAPLTAIFLIAEITGGYELMIPLMIVSSLSSAMVRFFQPISMEGQRLSKKLNASIGNRDQFLLSKLDLTELIETNFSILKIDQNLETMTKIISTSSRNVFPVVSDSGALIGTIHFDNIRAVIFDPANNANVTVKELMSAPAATIEVNESLESVLQKFDATKLWNLPVIENKRYVGFVSKSSILTRYRSELLESA
jgi:chloride channel protein, CIC family